MDSTTLAMMLAAEGRIADDAFPQESPLAFMNGWAPYTEDFVALQARMEKLWDTLWRNFTDETVAQTTLFAISGAWQVAHQRFAMCAPDGADLRQLAKRLSPSSEARH